MPTHEVLVPVGLPQGGLAKVGSLLNFDGPEDWKFRPLDPARRKAWEKEVANPVRVLEALERSPDSLCYPDEKPETFNYVWPQRKDI